VEAPAGRIEPDRRTPPPPKTPSRHPVGASFHACRVGATNCRQRLGGGCRSWSNELCLSAKLRARSFPVVVWYVSICIDTFIIVNYLQRIVKYDIPEMMTYRVKRASKHVHRIYVGTYGVVRLTPAIKMLHMLELGILLGWTPI